MKFKTIGLNRITKRARGDERGGLQAEEGSGMGMSKEEALWRSLVPSPTSHGWELS